MQRFKITLRWVRLWVLWLAISASACTMSVGEVSTPIVSEPQKSIYLVSHGWHAGVVLRRDDIADNIWPMTVETPDTHYLEVGWGDRDYYQKADPHLGILLKAALLPTASVLHIVGFNDPMQDFFPYSEIIRIDLSSTGFERLVQMIAESFARDEAGNVKPLGLGLYGDSHFYLSKERYHLFNTCNVWTARVLRAAGLPIIPVTAIRVESLMSQLRKLGEVVQSERDFHNE